MLCEQLISPSQKFILPHFSVSQMFVSWLSHIPFNDMQFYHFCANKHEPFKMHLALIFNIQNVLSFHSNFRVKFTKRQANVVCYGSCDMV
jgi:hypothetical protein